MKMTFFLGLLWIFTASADEAKPSFPCSKAKLPDEKLICADAELARLDTQLSHAFRIATVRAKATEKASLLREQKNWIESRQRCSGEAAKSCMTSAYTQRIAHLRGADGFERIDYYSDNDPGGIFRDKVIGEAIKKLLGPKYERFVSCMPTMEMFVKDKDSFGGRSFPGGVKGLFTIMEGIAVIAPDGRLWIAFIDEDKKIPYFTNVPEYRSKLPDTILAWMKTWNGKAERLKSDSVIYMNR